MGNSTEADVLWINFIVGFAIFPFRKASIMATKNIREQLCQQIDCLPDEVVEQIADFTLFVMAWRQISLSYAEWGHRQWQAFTLEQFFQEDDEVEYTLEDAQEIYHP
jgi:hypothetical protein